MRTSDDEGRVTPIRVLFWLLQGVCLGLALIAIAVIVSLVLRGLP